jgi:hypothetical protein
MKGILMPTTKAPKVPQVVPERNPHKRAGIHRRSELYEVKKEESIRVSGWRLKGWDQGWQNSGHSCGRGSFGIRRALEFAGE